MTHLESKTNKDDNIHKSEEQDIRQTNKQCPITPPPTPQQDIDCDKQREADTQKETEKESQRQAETRRDRNAPEHPPLCGQTR